MTVPGPLEAVPLPGVALAHPGHAAVAVLALALLALPFLRRGAGRWSYGLALAALGPVWSTLPAGEGAAGWPMLATGIGPLLAIGAGFPLWSRIAAVARQENLGSLADLMSARYSKSAMVGRLSALLSLLGALPFIALQLDGVARLAGAGVMPGLNGGRAVVLALLAAALVALALSGGKPGLRQQGARALGVLAVQAVAGAAVLGLGAILALATSGGGAAAAAGGAVPLPDGVLTPLALILLGAVGAFTLPHRFHVAFAAPDGPAEPRRARLVAPLAGAILLAGPLLAGALPVERAVAPGLLVTGPLASGLITTGLITTGLITVPALVATIMVIALELVAGSAMIVNALVLPLRRRLRGSGPGGGVPRDSARQIARLRQMTGLVFVLAAWLFYQQIGRHRPPLELGIVALIGFAQFLPALVGGLYWRRGHVDGAVAGIVGGSVLWLLTTAAPSLLSAITAEPAASARSDAEHTLVLALLLSLSVNSLLYVVFSQLARPRLVDAIQARLFVGNVRTAADLPADHPGIGPGALRDLLTPFIGPDEADKAIRGIMADAAGGPLPGTEPTVSPVQARAVERLLAGVIGAPAARSAIALAIGAEGQSTGEVQRILDEAAHAVHFSRDLLRGALEGLSQGVGVVDQDLHLVAWNAAYLSLLSFSAGEVYVGKPLSDLLLERSDGAGVNAIRSSLLGLNGSIARGERLEEEWQLEDGRTLNVVGKPLAQGDYLVTLTDVTSLRQAERLLGQDKEALERRVEQRTAELQAANAALTEATRAAEDATAAQKRFVATASHDLVQPLHAARLFISTVRDGVGLTPAQTALLRRADESVDGAHRLLLALLNLSRLETSPVAPALGPVGLDPIFASLCEEFADRAEAKGLRFVIRPTEQVVTSDADLLRSMLQNLILNAIRYTAAGTILVAARAAGDHVRIEVRDTGVGIAPDLLQTAFQEFSRLPEGVGMAEGAGLGLAIVARIGRALQHEVSVRSSPGRGSVFAVLVPRDSAAPLAVSGESFVPPRLDGMDILCIDDEPEVLDGMAALLEGWGARVETSASAGGIALRDGGWHAIIADHLLPGEPGLSILRRMAGMAPLRILLTATAPEGWEEILPAEGIVLLRKPAAPAELRALLARSAP